MLYIYNSVDKSKYVDCNIKKEAWLDKRSGKVCLAISPKAMKITGIDDRRYWEHISSDESRSFLNLSF